MFLCMLFMVGQTAGSIALKFTELKTQKARDRAPNRLGFNRFVNG